MARSCGDCQTCCRVLTISEIGKKAGERCDNQKFKAGCKVHGTPAQPMSCRRWSCWWLSDPKFDLPRPDRAGYVVDPLQDFVVLGDDVFSGERVPALQIWADLHRPEAWRAAIPWIKSVIGEMRAVAVIRFGSKEAVTLLPPCISTTGDWAEVDSRLMSEAHRAGVQSKMLDEAAKQAAEVMSNVEKESGDEHA